MSIDRMKLYCYVDETGQDARSRVFIVATVVLDSERESVRHALANIEKISRKGLNKWTRATVVQRQAYLQQVWRQEHLKGRVFFQSFDKRPETQFDYLAATATAAKEAILVVGAGTPVLATVVIDGLQKPLQNVVRQLISKRPLLTVQKVRGIRDESDEFLRLVDGVAGCSRSAQEGVNYARDLFVGGLRSGVLRELTG